MFRLCSRIFSAITRELGSQSVGVFDLDPLTVLDDDHAEGWPHPELFLDQQEVRSKLGTRCES